MQWQGLKIPIIIVSLLAGLALTLLSMAIPKVQLSGTAKCRPDKRKQ